MATTREERTAAIQDAVKERVARGMGYNEAFALVMKLPEFQPMVDEMAKPAEVVFPRFDPERGAKIADAVKELQGKFGYGYDQAFSEVRRDPKFTHLFENRSQVGQRE